MALFGRSKQHEREANKCSPGSLLRDVAVRCARFAVVRVRFVGPFRDGCHRVSESRSKFAREGSRRRDRCVTIVRFAVLRPRVLHATGVTEALG